MCVCSTDWKYCTVGPSVVCVETFVAQSSFILAGSFSTCCALIKLIPSPLYVILVSIESSASMATVNVFVAVVCVCVPCQSLPNWCALLSTCKRCAFTTQGMLSLCVWVCLCCAFVNLAPYLSLFERSVPNLTTLEDWSGPACATGQSSCSKKSEVNQPQLFLFSSTVKEFLHLLMLVWQPDGRIVYRKQ